MTMPTTRRAWLELPDGRLHVFDRECRVGRVPEGNDVALAERAISSRHLVVSAGAGGFVLVDQRSTNGTTVNGQPVLKPVRLKDGDEIRLAQLVTVRFRCDRNAPLDSPQDLAKTTVLLGSIEERECWLLLVDVVGFSTLIAERGNTTALGLLQKWIAEVRPLIESNGGVINRYVGDAIFACWPRRPSTTNAVLATAAAIEAFRPQAPVPFRVVLHEGTTYFTRSEVGDELTGQEVNFLFRIEKIAKRLNSRFMLSEPAALRLGLQHRCSSLGTHRVESIPGEFRFFDLTAGSLSQRST